MSAEEAEKEDARSKQLKIVIVGDGSSGKVCVAVARREGVCRRKSP